MKRRTIALLADYPVHELCTEIPQRGWYTSVWLVSLFEAFQKETDFDIHWITFHRKVHRRKVFRAGGQTFHVLPALLPGNISQRLHYLPDKWQVERELRKIRPDIVHAWGTETRYAIAAAAYSACPKILSMQGILHACLERAPMPAYYHRQRAYERQAMENYDLITSESEWGCERCREIVPTARIEAWEYAANERFFSLSRSLSKRPTCLMAGTGVPLKNPETAIAAFSSPALADITLLMVGAEKTDLPPLPPNVIATGGVSRESIAELLTSCWVLIHPSLADTSPNIVKEARVAGIPTIVSTECGGKQYVKHGESGYIIAPRDTSALIEAVLNLTRNADENLERGVCGQADCRRALNHETMYRRLKELYQTLSNTSL